MGKERKKGKGQHRPRDRRLQHAWTVLDVKQDSTVSLRNKFHARLAHVFYRENYTVIIFSIFHSIYKNSNNTCYIHFCQYSWNYNRFQHYNDWFALHGLANKFVPRG